MRFIFQEARPNEPLIETIQRLLRPWINQVSMLPKPVKRKLAEIEEIRKQYDIPKKLNIAIAEYEINGTKGLLRAVGGGTEQPGLVSEMPDPRHFQTHFHKGTDRGWDSEIYLLETISHTFEPSAEGEVLLYSERPPCPSCRSVVSQFQERFPQIHLNVYSGIV